MRLLLSLLFLLSAAPFPATAQTEQNHAQPWPTVFVSGPINDQVMISGELINRVSADETRSSQLEARLQIGHRLTDRLTGWIGYVHVVTYVADGRNGIDNQVVEQLNWNMGTLGKLRLSSRTRLEQRFLRGNDSVSWRIREQLRASLPIDRAGSAIVVWTEPFVELNTTNLTRGGLDQLRSFAGFSLPVGRHADVELGYLRQRLFRPGADIDNNVIPIVLNIRF
jgi:hypothetical protein